MTPVKVDPNVFGFPMPVVLVGTEVEGKPNFLTIGWVSRVNFQPPMIGFGSGKSHYSNAGIMGNKTFSVNVPSEDQVKVTDYCGISTGTQIDKSKLFRIFTGELEHTPMIADCGVCMECKLVQSVDLGADYFFIGEIVAAYAHQRVLTNGKPDMHKLKPLMLTMPDNLYWSLGKPLEKAWSIGKEYVQKDG